MLGCWEKRKGFCQPKRYIRAELRHPLRSYLLRTLQVLVVALILTVGIAVAGWDPTAVAAPVSQDSTLAVVGSGGAQLYATPGGETITELTPGTALNAVGRTDDNRWVVIHGSGALSGWLEVREVTILGLEQLPVMLKGDSPVSTDAGANATPAATPVPSETPSAPSTTNNTQASKQSTFVAVVRQGEFALYDRPDGTLLERLIPGTALMAQGRTEDGVWLAIEIPAGTSGWTQSTALVISNLEDLPVLDPATGLPVPTPPPVQTPATGAAPEAANAAVENGTPPIAPTGVTATVNVNNSRLNLRRGPTTDSQIVGQVNHGDQLQVAGRNTAATWVQVITPGVGDGINWVSADFVVLSNPILGIAVTEAASQEIAASPPVSPSTPPPASTNELPPTNVVVMGDIGCTSNQIPKWDDAQNAWVCSDDLTTLQADIAAFRAEIAALRAEISALALELSP